MGTELSLCRPRRSADNFTMLENLNVSPVRVLVANGPRLMRELIIETISDQPDIHVVGEIDDEAKIEGAVDETAPDFLIVTLDQQDHLPGFCQTILRKHANIKIIAVAPDRNLTVFYWAFLQVRSNRIEASEAGVLGALRGGLQSSGKVQ
jgi:DNA-binding NarL/FixJ family response regulator